MTPAYIGAGFVFVSIFFTVVNIGLFWVDKAEC
jgi:hypothetical protein